MDVSDRVYPYHVTVESIGDNECYHQWLKDNKIKIFQVRWAALESDPIINFRLKFKFEHEQDMLYFAMRWV